MSWARSNDGWFPRLFPGVAAQLGMDVPKADSSSIQAAAVQAKSE
jgi:hypothetical protein